MKNAFANYPSLAGKTVFVTGGASGIGAEIARGFSEQGALVGFIDLDRPASAAPRNWVVRLPMRFVTCVTSPH